MSHNEHAPKNSFFRALAAFLAAVAVLGACSLCAAAVRQRMPVSLGHPIGVTTVDMPLVCHCLHCTMPHGGNSAHGGMCCCCTSKQSGICLRASCDTGEAALLRVAGTPPIVPLARLVLLPPVAAPAARVFAPGRRDALPLIFVAPPAQPPRFST